MCVLVTGIPGLERWVSGTGITGLERWVLGTGIPRLPHKIYRVFFLKERVSINKMSFDWK